MPEDKAGPFSVSRRMMIGGAAASPAFAGAPSVIASEGDELLSRCSNFLTVDLRIERLTERWGNLETAAVTNHAEWWDLPEERRRALPEGREMAEIDQTLEGLFRERSRLLESLPELATRGTDGLLGKLVVAAKAIRPEDEPLIHRLLADAARDLAHMRCPDCNRPFTVEDVRRFVETLG